MKYRKISAGRNVAPRKNNTPIPYEEALKVCTKGSQKKVILECPQCKSLRTILFFAADPTKICRSCSAKQKQKKYCVVSGEANFFHKNPGKWARSGPENHMWNSKITAEERAERESNRTSSPQVKAWRKAVFERDDYSCKCCGTKNARPFNAHHLNSWKFFPEQRYAVENGVTLCHLCHKSFHRIYGRCAHKEHFLQFLNLDEKSLFERVA